MAKINDQMSKNNEQIKDQIANYNEQNNERMIKINEKIDGFQETVVGLTETIKTVESKVSNNVVVKEKVSQNEQNILMNYTKQQEELEWLLDECFNSTSYGLSAITTPEQGLTIESVLVGQAKYTAAIQLSNRPAFDFQWGPGQICTICYYVQDHF